MLTAAGVGVGLPAYSCSTSRIVGANDRLNIAVFGTNGRGMALTKQFAAAPNTSILGIGDVDTRAIEKAQKAVVEAGYKRPSGNQDFRTYLEHRVP